MYIDTYGERNILNTWFHYVHQGKLHKYSIKLNYIILSGFLPSLSHVWVLVSVQYTLPFSLLNYVFYHGHIYIPLSQSDYKISPINLSLSLTVWYRTIFRIKYICFFRNFNRLISRKQVFFIYHYLDHFLCVSSWNHIFSLFPSKILQTQKLTGIFLYLRFRIFNLVIIICF